jgi:hypothetical protein
LSLDYKNGLLFLCYWCKLSDNKESLEAAFHGTAKIGKNRH